VPDMLPNGLNEFIKHFYPQLNKKALIIDVRGNAGGNVSPMLIERLRREIDMVDIARNTTPSVDPRGTFYGPMLCLMNEYSASDGDLFPYRFHYYKLGQLVGKRSWGGVVGIRGSTSPSSRATTSKVRNGSSKATASIRMSSSTTTPPRSSPATISSSTRPSSSCCRT
jgi:C-terminal processing protease CtpA/Prc